MSRTKATSRLRPLLWLLPILFVALVYVVADVLSGRSETEVARAGVVSLRYDPDEWVTVSSSDGSVRGLPLVAPLAIQRVETDRVLVVGLAQDRAADVGVLSGDAAVKGTSLGGERNWQALEFRDPVRDEVRWLIGTSDGDVLASCPLAERASCRDVLRSLLVARTSTVAVHTSPEYAESVRDRVNAVDRRTRRAAPVLASFAWRSRDRAADAAEQLRTDVRSAKDALDDVSPPARDRAAHRRLTDALNALSTAYASLAVGLRRGEPTRYRDARREVRTAEAKLAAALTSLERNGYVRSSAAGTVRTPRPVTLAQTLPRRPATPTRTTRATTPQPSPSAPAPAPAPVTPAPSEGGGDSGAGSGPTIAPEG